MSFPKTERRGPIYFSRKGSESLILPLQETATLSPTFFSLILLPLEVTKSLVPNVIVKSSTSVVNFFLELYKVYKVTLYITRRFILQEKGQSFQILVICCSGNSGERSR